MMTRAQYADALEARAKVLKSAKGESAVVITRFAGAYETAQWTAWFKYWTTIEARATLMLIDGRQSWTVPAEYPWQIDLGYNG